MPRQLAFATTMAGPHLETRNHTQVSDSGSRQPALALIQIYLY